MFTETLLPVWPNGYSLLVLKGPEGEWTICPLDKRAGQETSRIKYRLPFDEGESMMTLLNGDDGEGEEYWRIGAKMSSRDMGYTGSVDESKTLIKMLHEGDAGLPDAGSILLENDFEVYMTSENSWMGSYVRYNHRKKSGFGVIVADQHIHLTYEPSRSPRWYNLLQLDGNRMNHDQTEMVYQFWPPRCKDFTRVAAAFIVENVRQRIERGGRKYYAPLGETHIPLPE